MTKMAAMPIYSKNLKKSSSPESKGRWPWNSVCSIGFPSTSKFVQMMSLGWPWPILRQGLIGSFMKKQKKKKNKKKNKKTNKKKLYKIRLQRDFFETWNFFPKGLSAQLLGLYTCINMKKKKKKKCTKSDFKDICLKLFWNLQQMNEVTGHFCWHQNFVPRGLSAPAPGLYTCI